MAKVEETYDGGRAIVVGGEGWHEGVKGIVASRLTNRYHVPALLFSIEDGVARGSGRSVGKVNLFDAVERCSDLLIRRGGHAGAVGVTIEASKLDEFRRRLSAVLSELPADDFEDTDEVAATVDLSELNIETIEQISRLEPFGQGNKVPLLAAEGVTMCDRAVVGKTGEHMRFVATDGAASVPAIMFRVPQIDRLINCDSAVDLVFEAVAEHWQGRVKPKLMIKDVLVRDTTAPNIDDPACELRRGVQPADLGPRLESRKRETLAQLSYTELTRSLIHSFIGSNQPHRAQVEALDALADHQSVLAVMGTGRGKSLIFHVHAAREAVLRGRASIFVYPLRALVADQAYHLSSTMAALGIGVGVLTGETVEAARDDVFAGLASGRTGIVLTTPEFLSIHRDRFARSGRIGFVVIDEAHHAGLAKGGDRSAYLDMPDILKALGDPVVMAATATATAPVVAELARVLPITPYGGRRDRARELAARGRPRSCEPRKPPGVHRRDGGEDRHLRYSRDQSVALAKTLRKRVPDYASHIAFYNAGLTRADRHRVEEAFRDGCLSCIVSTSAFGEGVNLPDIRHVVLYHMPFGAIEFNQMSGRAGRDGQPAVIHLLYSSRDARITSAYSTAMRPSATSSSRSIARCKPCGAPTRQDRGTIPLARAISTSRRCALPSMLARRSTSARWRVAWEFFEELGFCRVSGFDDTRRIAMAENPGRVQLSRSIRYLEGLRSRMEFSAFRSWALDSCASDMLAKVNRPIVPRA